MRAGGGAPFVRVERGALEQRGRVGAQLGVRHRREAHGERRALGARARALGADRRVEEQEEGACSELHRGVHLERTLAVHVEKGARLREQRATATRVA